MIMELVAQELARPRLKTPRGARHAGPPRVAGEAWPPLPDRPPLVWHLQLAQALSPLSREVVRRMFAHDWRTR